MGEKEKKDERIMLRCRCCGREITSEDVEAYGDRICGRCAIGVALVEGEESATETE